jgi:hypothetical protein
MTDRRQFIALAGLATAGLLLPRRLLAARTPDPIAMTIYKSPTCGCCVKWVDHVNANGFAARVIDVPDADRLDDLKTTSGVPGALRSCHLALVGSYAVEGHVPADLIHKMLREKPQARGLAVPGMVTGTPGMEVPGRAADKYNVLLFQRDGKTTVYAAR